MFQLPATPQPVSHYQACWLGWEIGRGRLAITAAAPATCRMSEPLATAGLHPHAALSRPAAADASGLHAMSLVATYLRQAVRSPTDMRAVGMLA